MSNSGKELKKLLGRTTGLNESDEEDDYDEEDVSFHLITIHLIIVWEDM